MKKTVVSKSKKATPAPAKKPLSKVGEYLRFGKISNSNTNQKPISKAGEQLMSGISMIGDIKLTPADMRIILK